MKYIFMLPVLIYKKVISPLFPARCKYYPTCSSYAVQSLKRFGVMRGSILAIWRILRCNPWSEGGIDLVPERFTLKAKNKRRNKSL